jgi:ribosomal protein S18 acetylase RimI-like enzyme
MNSSVAIRRADVADAQLLADLGARTFVETFGPDNTAEDMAAHVATTFAPGIIDGELRSSQNLYLIAMVDGEAAGYAKLRWNDVHEGVAGERPAQLTRIYVDSTWQGRGVGPQLMDRCLEEARNHGADVIWLGVWERNPRAINFYEKWGFTKVSEHEFVLGADPQLDWVMARPVEPRVVDGFGRNSDNGSRNYTEAPEGARTEI